MKSIVKTCLLLLLVLFFAGCRLDHGLGTLDSKISGKILFLNPQKQPAYVEAVRVVAAVNLPPQNLGDVVFTNSSINLSKEQPEYEIPAPITTYQMVAAIYKKKGEAWNYANILGFYGYDPINYKFEYKPVVLSKEHPIASGIDIYCDWSLLRP